jgi:ribosomal protein S27AE
VPPRQEINYLIIALLSKNRTCPRHGMEIVAQHENCGENCGTEKLFQLAGVTESAEQKNEIVVKFWERHHPGLVGLDLAGKILQEPKRKNSALEQSVHCSEVTYIFN